jgi:predicted GIY-YIG superfamily endonuclease
MKLRKKKDLEEDPKHTILLPYVSGLSEDLRRICCKQGIRIVFTTPTTLRQQLTRVKDKDPPLNRSGVVYRIPCSCGLAYIGETKRMLETRLKEHMAATRRGEIDKSAMAEHVWSHQHQPQWDETSILDQDNKHILRIKEALHIMLANPQTLINRDQGTAISDCWTPVLQHCGSGTRLPSQP